MNSQIHSFTCLLTEKGFFCHFIEKMSIFFNTFRIWNSERDKNNILWK